MCRTGSLNKIENLIQNISPIDGEAEKKIRSYCSKVGVVTDYSVRKNTTLVTFEEFLVLVTAELPKRNDIVSLSSDNSQVIVKSCDLDEFVVAITKLVSGEIQIEQKKIPLCDFYFVSLDDLEEFQISLAKLDLDWDSFNSKITPRFLAKINQHVRITRLGIKVCIGVIKEINSYNEIVLYCAVANDDSVDFSMNYNVGSLESFQIELMNMSEREILTEGLLSKGVIWNGHQRRIEPENLRVNLGEEYYYVDLLFSVVTTKDLGKPKDYKRFKALNYFNNKENALRYKDIMYKERLKLLLE